MSKISIIIPTINEANNLPLLLSDLSIIENEGEIIIVDCGSEDKTIDLANIYGAKVFKSKEKNRGLQLNIGAHNAKGVIDLTRVRAISVLNEKKRSIIKLNSPSREWQIMPSAGDIGTLLAVFQKGNLQVSNTPKAQKLINPRSNKDKASLTEPSDA